MSISCIDAQNEPLFQLEPGHHTLWQQIIIQGLLKAPLESPQLRALDQLKNRKTIISWSQNKVPQQDWQTLHKIDHPATRHGSHLWVCPSWDASPDDPEAVIVSIDPGLAFGTGTHPTTSLCLTWLEQHPEKDNTIIDFGCGSGILSIAAAKLGYPRVDAIDHDPQAIAASRKNIKKNHVESCVSVHEPGNAPLHKADIIIANILLHPLLNLQQTFRQQLKHRGVCVLSGILIQQVPQLLAEYHEHFTHITTAQRNDWACCVLKSKT